MSWKKTWSFKRIFRIPRQNWKLLKLQTANWQRKLTRRNLWTLWSSRNVCVFRLCLSKWRIYKLTACLLFRHGASVKMQLNIWSPLKPQGYNKLLTTMESSLKDRADLTEGTRRILDKIHQNPSKSTRCTAVAPDGGFFKAWCVCQAFRKAIKGLIATSSATNMRSVVSRCE